MTEPKITIQDAPAIPKKTHPLFHTKYSFGLIEPGKMMLIECPTEDRNTAMKRVSVAANQWCGRRGIQNIFIVRTLPEGVGVFRLAEEAEPPEEK